MADLRAGAPRVCNGSMRFRLLACDYDRTIALNGVVPDPTRRALRDVRDSGRSLVLVTGRTMAELLDVFDELTLFARIIVENGAVLCEPASGAERVLSPPVPARLVEELRRREVQPLIVGKGIISTAEPNDAQVLVALSELGLDLKLSYNRDSVMILAPNVSKATGLRAAADSINIPLDEAVAVGDGENDLALLDAAGIGVAVENAVGPLKDHADIVLTRPAAEGIRELCDSLVRHDLADLLEEASAAPA